MLGGTSCARVAERYGPDLVDLAFSDFMISDEPIDERHEQLIFDNALLPWKLFNWRPGTEWVGDAEAPPLPEQPLALEYLAAHASELDDFDRRFIRTVCRRPYSFYAVTAVQRGRSMQLRDIMTGCECVV